MEMAPSAQPSTNGLAGSPALATAENITGGRLAEVERAEIIKALEQFDGHKGHAADYLGINRKTLREKIRRYEIPDPS